MKKTIFSLLLLAVCSLGASAQSADELDAKYTQGLLKVGTQAPDFVLKKAKARPACAFFVFLQHPSGRHIVASWLLGSARLLGYMVSRLSQGDS